MQIKKNIAVTILLVTAISSSSFAIEKSPLTFESSDPNMVTCFNWAKAQALQFVFQGDPVGLWYEASVPGREAFCMRDTSHQVLGAHLIGLDKHTLNMLGKFAKHISRSKDFCTYWELNRYNKPAPIDYRNDKEFWYDLPANFEVLDACWRAYLWTHDKSYINDKNFNRFYKLTTNDYVKRWELQLGKIQTRKRYMNRPTFDPKDKYQFSRGIPSYHEGPPQNIRFGADLLASQVAAYRAYSKILKLQNKNKQADIFSTKAKDITSFLEDTLWDKANDRPYELMLTDNSCVTDTGTQVYLLYHDALRSLDKKVKTLYAITKGPQITIEIHSHYAQVYYRYGQPQIAYDWLMKLSDPKMPRRDYPEVSYGTIATITEGLMGVEPSQTENKIATLSRLTTKTKWAKISNLPFHKNIIDIEHRSNNQSTLTNHSSNTITWQARFYGNEEQLTIDCKKVKAQKGQDKVNNPYVWTEIKVAPNRSVTVTK